MKEMNGLNHSATPYRGIVVVDANEIETLSIPYKVTEIGTPLSNLRIKGAASESYLDLLAVLAQYGYQIIIPEMVSKEAADMLANGKDVGGCFPYKRQKYPTEKQAKCFCHHASPATPSPYANVGIAQAEEGAIYTRYLRPFYTMTDPGAINKHEQQYIDMKHAGERHCCDVIVKEMKRQREAHEHIPIFFLTSDGGARDMLKERLLQEGLAEVNGVSPINALTANGIIIALEKEKASETNALTLCGLKGRGEDHWHHIKSMNNDRYLPGYYGDRNKDYYDAPLGQYNTEQFPFAASMHGLAKELMKRPKSPLEKFKLRSAKSAHHSNSVNGRAG